MLSQSQLFARLAEGHAARITVVTPNRRLALSLTLEFDDYQIARGLTSWEAADILPFGSWVERLWEDALYSDLGEKLPLLLTPAQEQHLWEAILAKSGLLIVPQAAAQCREAWRLIHQWRVGTAQVNEDTQAFERWSSAYRKQTQGEIDAARLPDLMLEYLPKLKTPALVVAYAFDAMPPQTREFLARFTTEECAPDPVKASIARAPFASAKHELEAAARWARARLEEGKQRIGVVVPDLGKRRQEVARIFSRTMQPGYNLPGAAKTPMPFDISLGRPLSAYPLVAAALGLLQLSNESVEFGLASSLIRSPFIGGADSEMSKRAALDVRIRRDADATISLPKLISHLADHTPLLRRSLERVFETAKGKAESPAEWARHFSAVLDAYGFPGERAPDSDEFQTRVKWHEALGELAKLERIAERMSFDAALTTLKRLCEGLFQPESPDTPIQVLGVMEAQGQRFDCLWVAGLTDQVWPRDATPNPFIPIAAQKKAGIPQSSAESALAYDRRITDEWRHSAAEVVFSHPTKDEERDLAPSPLIQQIPIGSIAVPDYPRYRDLVFSAKKLESFQDVKAPPVKTGKQQRGGTRVLADQAMCPFRAFARWRLGADAMEEPAPGLDARDRGKLLHALMREIWTRVRSHSNLNKDLTTVIAQSAETAVKEMGLEGRFAELERERLARLAGEWLEVERRRAPFDVEFVEQQRELSVAGMKLDSRIDRMDKLDEGGHVLIDYKTGGMMGTRQWEGPRPDDPQVPLYAIAAPEELAAVTFAKLRAGEMRFVGYSRTGNLLPQVAPPPRTQWSELLAQWRRTAEALGSAFVNGDAKVDPKEELKTCRRCELQTLCRVYEKLSALRSE